MGVAVELKLPAQGWRIGAPQTPGRGLQVKFYVAYSARLAAPTERLLNNFGIYFLF